MNEVLEGNEQLSCCGNESPWCLGAIIRSRCKFHNYLHELQATPAAIAHPLRHRPSLLILNSPYPQQHQATTPHRLSFPAPPVFDRAGTISCHHELISVFHVKPRDRQGIAVVSGLSVKISWPYAGFPGLLISGLELLFTTIRAVNRRASRTPSVGENG